MSSITNIISFPGLGIGEFKVNNVAFSVFGLNIAWYGIIITAGMIAAFLYASWRAVKFEGQKFDDMLDYAIYCIIFGVIGARAYYIIMDDSHYTIKQMFALRDGGLAIYGGIIAGALTALVVTKIKKLKFSKIADAIAPGVILAQSIGRWGNFMNGEAYGSFTDLPWRMGFTLPYGTIYVHPTFLYESLWNLLGFVLINIYYKKKKFNGEIALKCMTWLWTHVHRGASYRQSLYRKYKSFTACRISELYLRTYNHNISEILCEKAQRFTAFNYSWSIECFCFGN